MGPILFFFSGEESNTFFIHVFINLVGVGYCSVQLSSI